MKHKLVAETFLVKVVPYIGTWIETKPFFTRFNTVLVVPYIGTWIETESGFSTSYERRVVPYIGTWIETITMMLVNF